MNYIRGQRRKLLRYLASGGEAIMESPCMHLSTRDRRGFDGAAESKFLKRQRSTVLPALLPVSTRR